MSDLYRTTDKANMWDGQKLESMVRDGVLVKVEATDRICTEHGELAHAGATACEGGPEPSFHWWDDCVMVDVVRMAT